MRAGVTGMVPPYQDRAPLVTWQLRGEGLAGFTRG
jgi:hypothetical protein